MAEPDSIRWKLESGGSSGPLAPEIHHSACKRLAWVALCYSIGYLLAYGYFLSQVAAHHVAPPSPFKHVIAGLATLLGIVVYVRTKKCVPSTDLTCRAPSGKRPSIEYANIALFFQILAAFGIVATFWGWEHDLNRNLINAGTALGIDSERITVDFVRRLSAPNVHLFQFLGVSWVGVWIMFFPLVVPVPPRRAAWSAFLTATTVPLVLLFSLLIEGVPENTRPWIHAYVAQMTVPTYICAIFAVIASRVVYNLSHTLSRARRMGSYHLVERIGAGGMGEVWKAQHRMLARPGAIKLIRPDALGAGTGPAAAAALKRFEREAQATAALRSPHTVDLYDFGVTEDGQFYYVMEFLDGIDLKTLVLRHGPVPPERALSLLRQACDSLAEAHARGLVHRDIKPANIFACRYGLEVDYVKVLDFGLVKESKQIDQEDSQLTATGSLPGTPSFMAPEMVYGDRSVDPRADIYALGAVGYWLLTGQLVFEGNSPVEVMLKQINDTPAPPSSRSEIEIPCEVERIILRCLEKEPEKRPQSAEELADMLTECASSQSSWSRERALNWWTLHMAEKVPEPIDADSLTHGAAASVKDHQAPCGDC